MAKTSLILKATDQNGKTVNKTITDVNPDCSNEVLKTLGQKINALTTNFYGNTTRIDKIDCDLESGGGTTVPTLTLSESTITLSAFNTAVTGTGGNLGFKEVVITYNGDGQLSLVFEPSTDATTRMCVAALNQSTSAGWELWFGQNRFSNRTGTVRIKASATDNYKAAEATYTITE